jgi:hypothetical protein
MFHGLKNSYFWLFKGTLTQKIWVQEREPEHLLDLKDEPPTLLKIF